MCVGWNEQARDQADARIVFCPNGYRGRHQVHSCTLTAIGERTMRRVKVFLLSTALLLSLGANMCRAQDRIAQVEKGRVGMSIFIDPADTIEAGGTLTLYVFAQVAPGLGPDGVFHVSLPEGLHLVSGDTAFTAHISESTPATDQIGVHVEKQGSYDVWATAEIGAAPGEVDFVEVSMRVLVVGHTIHHSFSAVRRLECVRAGRRFRIAGPWLVPMDQGERFDPAEFQSVGTRARELPRPSIVCERCPSGVSDSVGFFVVIGKDGRVLQAELGGTMPGRSRSKEVIDSARASLGLLRFEPARIGTAAVNDVIYISVPVIGR